MPALKVDTVVFSRCDWGTLVPVELKELEAHMFLTIWYCRLPGLVVWFSLRQRKVLSSILGVGLTLKTWTALQIIIIVSWTRCLPPLPLWRNVLSFRIAIPTGDLLSCNILYYYWVEARCARVTQAAPMKASSSLQVTIYRWTANFNLISVFTSHRVRQKKTRITNV